MFEFGISYTQVNSEVEYTGRSQNPNLIFFPARFIGPLVT